MNDFMDKYNNLIDKLMHFNEKIGDAFFNVLKKVLKIFDIFFRRINLTYRVFGFIIYPFSRFLTIPFNWLIIRTWLWYVLRAFDSQPYLTNKLKQWKGEPGAGKSLSSFVIAEMIREETGMASYFTAQVEKPRLSECGTYWYVYHRVIKLSDYYKNYQKVMNFNTEKYSTIWKDENNVRQNYRFNKDKEYNAEFKPEHDDEVLLRHLGFKHGMNVISQQTKTDSQRMETVGFYFEVNKTVKGIDYIKWLFDGVFEIVPRKIKIDVYTLDIGWGENKRKFYRKISLRVPRDILDHYETLSEKNRFSHLRIDYK